MKIFGGQFIASSKRIVGSNLLAGNVILNFNCFLFYLYSFDTNLVKCDWTTLIDFRSTLMTTRPWLQSSNTVWGKNIHNRLYRTILTLLLASTDGTTISQISYPFSRRSCWTRHWSTLHSRRKDVNCKRIKLCYRHVARIFRYAILCFLIWYLTKISFLCSLCSQRILVNIRL